MMVTAGWALDFERYSKAFCAQEQKQAKDARRGLLGGDFMRPWNWRRDKPRADGSGAK
jgi:endonuclease YncB( thermonuclease family)